MPNENIEVRTLNSDAELPQFALHAAGDDDGLLMTESGQGQGPLPLPRHLPRVKILGTGGTIASKGSKSSDTAGYRVDLTIDELLEAIPDIKDVCEIEYEQLCNLDSKEIGVDELWKIYRGVCESLQRFDGIVITHGTDTLAETTFFIESTIDAGQVPIVFVGSMRPSTSISADGPMNLYQAICIAANKESRGRGVLISLNDQISAGYYITKTNANTLDSFNVRQGYLGNFVNNEIHYYYPPVKPLGCHKFKLDVGEELRLPSVCILYAHQSFSPELVELVAQQYEGIVIATMGAGSLSSEVNETCKKLRLPIVYSKRSMDGMVPVANLPIEPSNPASTIIASGYLNPEKSRILLQLCLKQKYSIPKIRTVFQGVYGG
ncbi:L-asparaginase 1 [Kluyveromyces marxianus]|nr:L-asparaginase 1 [Kluyveromyces marxianus]